MIETKPDFDFKPYTPQIITSWNKSYWLAQQTGSTQVIDSSKKTNPRRDYGALNRRVIPKLDFASQELKVTNQVYNKLNL
jgi:hypothetical protein